MHTNLQKLQAKANLNKLLMNEVVLYVAFSNIFKRKIKAVHSSHRWVERHQPNDLRKKNGSTKTVTIQIIVSDIHTNNLVGEISTNPKINLTSF